MEFRIKCEEGLDHIFRKVVIIIRRHTTRTKSSTERFRESYRNRFKDGSRVFILEVDKLSYRTFLDLEEFKKEMKELRIHCRVSTDSGFFTIHIENFNEG